MADLSSALSAGLDWYSKRLKEAPIEIQRQELPTWFSMPLILISSFAIFMFGRFAKTGNFSTPSIPATLAGPDYAYALEIAASVFFAFCLIFIARRFLPAADKSKVEVIDPKEDVLSEIRKGMIGRWKLHHSKFSELPGLKSFDIDLNCGITVAKKLFFAIDQKNDLGIHDNVEEISISVDESSRKISLSFFIDRSLDQLGRNIGTDYKYFYQLSWTAGAGNNNQFGGTWYALGDLGRDFKASGPCSFDKQLS